MPLFDLILCASIDSRADPAPPRPESSWRESLIEVISARGKSSRWVKGTKKKVWVWVQVSALSSAARKVQTTGRRCEETQLRTKGQY